MTLLSNVAHIVIKTNTTFPNSVLGLPNIFLEKNNKKIEKSPADIFLG